MIQEWLYFKQGTYNEHKIFFGDVYKNKNYVLFLKYNFTNKVVYKSKDMIERAMAEYGSYNIVVKTNNKVLNSQIVKLTRDRQS